MTPPAKANLLLVPPERHALCTYRRGRISKCLPNDLSPCAPSRIWFHGCGRSSGWKFDCLPHISWPEVKQNPHRKCRGNAGDLGQALSYTVLTSWHFVLLTSLSCPSLVISVSLHYCLYIVVLCLPHGIKIIQATKNIIASFSWVNFHLIYIWYGSFNIFTSKKAVLFYYSTNFLNLGFQAHLVLEVWWNRKPWSLNNLIVMMNDGGIFTGKGWYGLFGSLYFQDLLFVWFSQISYFSLLFVWFSGPTFTEWIQM